MKNYLPEAQSLLSELIKTPSFSREEDKTAEILEEQFQKNKISYRRICNNIVAWNKYQEPDKPVLVLNSHHDTVKITKGWIEDPFGAVLKDGKLYGLGSNDAGGSLVSLLFTFIHFYDYKELPFRLLFIASAEEEVFGNNGLSRVLSELGEDIDLAIIGEPTSMKMATSEKGLMVVDATATGVAGHVANGNGCDNAIYKAMKDIAWIQNYQFKKFSPVLGEVKKAVTQIEAGYQHNIVPDHCKFVIDLRINDQYKNLEVLEILRNNCQSELIPRSTKWQASKIDLDHPLVQRGLSLGLEYYGSSTLSDQVHFSCPSLKLGCGESSRSHTADEYIHLSEIENAIKIYINLLSNLKITQ